MKVLTCVFCGGVKREVDYAFDADNRDCVCSKCNFDIESISHSELKKKKVSIALANKLIKIEDLIV